LNIEEPDMATTVDITSIPQTRSKFDEKNHVLVVAASLLGLVLCVSAFVYLLAAPTAGALEAFQMVIPGL
jgi:hypothetical protein